MLVVDDDPFIRRLIETTLADVADCDVVQAGDGEEAVALARRTRPRLVFLDVDMPGRDGLDTCRALRADAALRATRIVMLTGSDHHRQQARDAGADLFLTKPFSPLELLRLVDETGA